MEQVAEDGKVKLGIYGGMLVLERKKRMSNVRLLTGSGKNNNEKREKNEERSDGGGAGGRADKGRRNQRKYA